MTTSKPVDADDPLGTLTDGAGFSAERLSRIDRFFEVEIARGRMPGGVLLIERRGETVMRRAYGHRNRGAGQKMTFDTIFRIYSMTKPLVSLVTVMLAAEGRLHLGQPVSDIIPSFANLRVWTEHGLVKPERAPTVHDLLRHTAGLIYERNGGPVASLYAQADLLASDITNEEFADRIATLPLAYHPSRIWDYSHATDVLGRVVEVVSGRSLGHLLRQRLTEPLGMADTGFVVPRKDFERVAEALPGDTFSPAGKPLFDPRRARSLEAGGMGLVSTLDDYARFCRMLLAGGSTEARTFLAKPTLRFMAADHIGPATGIRRLPGSMLEPGFGFGLGFAVRNEFGAASIPGSVGELNWTGIVGTYFWIDPAEDLFVVFLSQAPGHRLRYRQALKTMVYDAFVGGKGIRREKRRRKKSH